MRLHEDFLETCEILAGFEDIVCNILFERFCLILQFVLNIRKYASKNGFADKFIEFTDRICFKILRSAFMLKLNRSIPSPYSCGLQGLPITLLKTCGSVSGFELCYEMSSILCIDEDQLGIVATFGFFSACRAIGLSNSRSFIASIGLLKQIPKILHLFSRFQALAIEILLKRYFNRKTDDYGIFEILSIHSS